MVISNPFLLVLWDFIILKTSAEKGIKEAFVYDVCKI